VLSVSFEGREMKREWKKKLDIEGLQLVEAHARLQRLGPPPLTNRQDFVKWVTQNKQIQNSYPELHNHRRIKVTPEFVEFYLLGDPESAQQVSRDELASLFTEEEWPAPIADALEIAEKLWMTFEGDPKERAGAYVAIGAWISTIGPMINDMKERQFGKASTDARQYFIAMAQVLEWFGSALRGRAEVPRGRVNIELAKLVNAILSHEKERLTQVELYEALKEAGAEIPSDPEVFRVWLHRARKSGLVTDGGAKRSSRSDKS